jgi:putative transposase
MRVSEKSIATGKPYPVRMVLKMAGLSSAAWYTVRRAKTTKQRPGPKPVISDEALVMAIREDLATSRFHSEGHKKVRARLRRRGIRAGRKRYLRLMKAHNLLAPVRPQWNGSSRPHDGKIVTDHPNRMWGTDGKQFWTRQNGLCWFFGTIRSLERRNPWLARLDHRRSLCRAGAGASSHSQGVWILGQGSGARHGFVFAQ